jgi:hypothetical protein
LNLPLLIQSAHELWPIPFARHRAYRTVKFPGCDHPVRVFGVHYGKFRPMTVRRGSQKQEQLPPFWANPPCIDGMLAAVA